MSQSFMWSFFVVLLEPLFRLLTNFVQALKHEHVEHRFAVAAIESLDEAILHRLANLLRFIRSPSGLLCCAGNLYFLMVRILGRVTIRSFNTLDHPYGPFQSTVVLNKCFEHFEAGFDIYTLN